MRKTTRYLLAALTGVLLQAAGPEEFGKAELDRAIAARGLGGLSVETAIVPGPAESYRISGGRVTGADARGLMYGLLEAAEQVREQGRLVEAQGAPATPVRGIRYYLHNKEMEEEWYYSREYWDEYFAMLARNRYNRFNLVFAHQTHYLSPPYPYWLSVAAHPEVRAPGVTAAEQRRNLEMLRYISDAAAAHGIDFTLGIWQHNVQTWMKPVVEGLTLENIGPYSYTALKRVLAECPSINGVQLRTNTESGLPRGRQTPFFRDWVFRAIREAGRPVRLELRGWAMEEGMMDAALATGAPLWLSCKYWAEHRGRAYQPAETWPGYSYIDFLKRPRVYQALLWEVWGMSHRLLLWGAPEHVRRMAPTFTLGGTQGFEIDPPLAQKGYWNRPGKWGIFTEAQRERVFWKHEFERYWFFYLLWGRLSYDPKTPDTVWRSELERRYGAAAADALEAYSAASEVINEIGAAHIADPNQYIWPEINPGGLLDAYIHVQPSDWRYIASIPEAVDNRVRGVASAKQTPADTAALLNGLAARIEEAAERIGRKLPGSHREWRGSEPDFRVLAALARFHARRQVAAEQLELFYRTGDAAALRAARSEAAAGLQVWRKLAAYTDGLYPEEMSFARGDQGHWKDKLPYVEHDLAALAEREEILRRFGRFARGFDFGAPVTRVTLMPGTGRAPFRGDAAVRLNTVEPRFEAVAPDSAYSEESGFGWMGAGTREASGIAPTPFDEVRAVSRKPGNLPRDVLFRDSIRGRGAQTFRVRTGPGVFTVRYLHPDRTVKTAKLEAVRGFVDVPFEGEWDVSGLVLEGKAAPAPVPAAGKRGPRPAFTHTPPARAEAGKPLALRLGVPPRGGVATVRLHYRAMNQLAQFRSVESKTGEFTIPGSEVPGDSDLMYYFEVLGGGGNGWFYPDPAERTPYFVVGTGGR